jgi:hypothetical protein
MKLNLRIDSLLLHINMHNQMRVYRSWALTLKPSRNALRKKPDSQHKTAR